MPYHLRSSVQGVWADMVWGGTVDKSGTGWVQGLFVVSLCLLIINHVTHHADLKNEIILNQCSDDLKFCMLTSAV